MDQIKVVLAEDHNIVRQGLRLLIEAHDDFAVVGEAADGKSALQLILELCPHVAVIDISMPLMNGLELARQLQATQLSTKLLALTANEDPAYMHQLLQLGVSGYLLKRSASEDLIQAIREVASGSRYLDPSIVRNVVNGLFDTTSSEPKSPVADLTEREVEVMKLLANGQTNKEVAALLDISVKTVETHKARAMFKLGIRSRAELVRHAIVKGWLS